MKSFIQTNLFALLLACCFSASAADTVTVSGKVDLGKDANKVDFTKATAKLYTRTAYPRPDYPTDYAKMTPEKRRAWFTEYYKSDAGKAFMKKVEDARKNTINIAIKMNKDGSFKVDNVTPGKTYYLSISATDPKSKAERPEPIIRLSKSVKVTDKDVDLGVMKTVIIKNIKVGDPAPLFDFKTVHGKEHKLADFKGKYVLVDFWAVWCGPCRGETPNLKQVYDKFGNKANFAMIGLSLDNATKEPIEYAKKNDLKWIQGYLGKWSDDKVTKLYNVRGIPSIWLIGPDGKILEKGLRGARIGEAIEKHMKKGESKA